MQPLSRDQKLIAKNLGRIFLFDTAAALQELRGGKDVGFMHHRQVRFRFVNRGWI